MRSKIKNFKDLATTELRNALLEIAEAGLEAIDTGDVIRDEVSLSGDELRIGEHKYSLKEISNLYIFGAGKCVFEAAEALEKVLGDRLTGGLVLDVEIPKGCSLRKVKCIKGTHPMPSATNVRAAKRMSKELKDLDEKDLALFLVSGGGSALLCFPQDGVSYKQEVDVQKILFKQGAAIEEINTVRKHLSLVRGGHLAEYVYPARAVSIIFSDVPGNKLEFISSGPTVRDNTTVADAEAILKKYGIVKHNRLKSLSFIETPKEEKYFLNIDNIMLISNRRALDAMADRARELNYRAEVITDHLTGEARDVARTIVQDLRACPSRSVRLYGGETTVTITARGRGGRNRELALAALLSIGDDECLASIASDGRDNGRHAGGIADKETIRHAERIRLDTKQYLEKNRSARFFERTGDYIMTGDTGSNVSDLVIAIKN